MLHFLLGLSLIDQVWNLNKISSVFFFFVWSFLYIFFVSLLHIIFLHHLFASSFCIIFLYFCYNPFTLFNHNYFGREWVIYGHATRKWEAMEKVFTPLKVVFFFRSVWKLIWIFDKIWLFWNIEKLTHGINFFTILTDHVYFLYNNALILVPFKK